MKDARLSLYEEIEGVLHEFIEDKSLFDLTASKILIVLDNYEVSTRCTDIVTVDDSNQKIIKKYVASCYISGLSQYTIKQYVYTLHRFMKVLNNKPLTEINAYDIRYFLAVMKMRGTVSDVTLDSYRMYISSFYTWLFKEEIIPRSPCINIRPIRHKKNMKFSFTPMDIDNLRSACKDKRERALIEFLLSSGVIVNELVHLCKKDVNLQTHTVHVIFGKGNKERITYINDVTEMHLRRYLNSRKDTNERLFVGKIGEKKELTPCGVRNIFRNLGRRAHIDNVHPHRFRRTFATNLFQRGMSVREIQKLMGHSKIDTTLGYIATCEQQLETEYNKYSE